MQRGRWFLATTAIAFALLTTAYLLFVDRLPPRTPVKVARLVSGLAIPRNAKVLRFDDRWNTFNGDGTSLVVLQLPRDQILRLIEAARRKGFARISPTDSLPDAIARDLAPHVDGVVKIERDNSSTSATVIDSIGARVWVLLEIT